MKFRQGDTTQVLIEFDQSLGELDLKVGIYRLDTDAIAVESILSDEGSLIEYIGNNAYSMVIPHSVTVEWVGKYYLDILVKSPNDTSFVNSCEKPIRFTFGAAKISTNLANHTESETPDAEFESSGMPNEDYNLHATVTISQPSLNIAGEQYPTLTAMVSFGNWFKGQDGKDAKINGYNTIEIVEGEGIDIEQEEGTLTISSKHSYQSLRRLGEYLYEMTFATLPQYVPSNTLNVGGCTSFVRDGKLYRNLDWKYDEAPTFVIKTKEFDGIAFDNSVSDGNMRDAVFGQLPYHIVDGCNRHGIMGSVHVLYNDFGWYGNGSIPLTKALYEVLTRVTSMQSIQSELSPIIGDLATTPELDAAEYLLQFVITDGVTTYVLTPTSGGYELVNITSNPKLTNFKWVSKQTLQRNDSDLQDRPTGIERWNTIDDDTELSDLRFTKAYETPDRLSEFIGIDGTTKDSTDEELEEIYDRAHAAYLTRTRDGLLWQTMHSVVYGTNGIEHLWCQENWDVDFVSKGGGEFEQVQADWNENDSNSKAHIINRICHEEYATIIDGTYDAINMHEPYDYLLSTIGGSIEIQEGVQYTVTFADEQPITCIVRYLESEGLEYVGNINILFTIRGVPKPEYDTGEEFFIGYFVSSFVAVLTGSLYRDDERMTVKVEGNVISKIDNKWIDVRSIRSGLAPIDEVSEALDYKEDVIEDLDEIRSGAEKGETALQPSALDDYRTSSAQDAIDEAIQGDIEAIENKIPSQATSSNKLADKNFVNSSLNSITAFYITKDAQGTQFATKAQLDVTTTFYSGGEVRVPTRNDYCIVLADETKTDPVTGENPTTRYIYQNGWEFQYIVNKTTLTAAQLAAINSGITSGKVSQYDDYATSKQDSISDLATIRSGAALGATAYQKPSSGIPASDLAVGVIPDISAKENTSNKVSVFQSIPDNTHYPTEKLVYDSLAQKLSNYDFAFLTLNDNTTSFTFPANQRCYQKVSIAASATLNFAVENMTDNYVRVYNSGSSEIILAIGNVTHNSTLVSAKVGPAEIKCCTGRYIEISVIYDGSDATFTASENLQVLS